MVGVACENSDAIKVGSSNFVMWELDGTESYASAFHMVRSYWGAMVLESENGRAGIRWAINDVLMARIADIGEDSIVEDRADERVQIGHLFGPKIEDLARPRVDVEHNALASCLEIGCIGQYAKVCILGVFEMCLCEVFNW
jgi:hypothetical protein